MTSAAFVNLSFRQLSERLKTRFDQPDSDDDIDLEGVFEYLVSIPLSLQTSDSVDALLQLAKNLWLAGDLSQVLRASSHAEKVAHALGDNELLCLARSMTGVAQSDLGNFGAATVSLVECWALAREIGDVRREAIAIVDFGQLCGGMGQYEVAARYFERAIEIAEERHEYDVELRARINLAVCAIELRQPAIGFAALSQTDFNAPETRTNLIIHSSAHSNLAHLHLLAGDLSSAQLHANKCAELAGIAGGRRAERAAEALQGLIDVHSGAVDKGLLMLERALEDAERAEHTEILGLLRMCADAYEFAGRPDRALEYLQELVAVKRKTIDIDIMQLGADGYGEGSELQTNISLFDRGLAATASSLQVGVQRRLRHLVEMAINAEIAAGHDLHRTFRLANLARCLAMQLGWNKERVAPLTLGAQLCNIGMMAIPTDILQKPQPLSVAERYVLCDHTKYGAELLRNSRLTCLDMAGTVAEQHHERYDGSGYPRGLSGKSISDEARIVAVCDAFDTMTHRHPWRPTALSIGDSISEILKNAGSQFDPLYANALVAWLKRDDWNPEQLDAFLAEGADELEYVRARARIEILLPHTTVSATQQSSQSI